jgi:exosortase/archaeosortase family protein
VLGERDSGAPVGSAAPHVRAASGRAAGRGRRGAHAAPPSQRIRLVPMAALAMAAVLLLVFQYQFRDLEAAAAAHLFGIITPTLAAPGAPIIWFGLGAPGAFGLMITPDCSSALLIAPLCVLGIGLMIPRRLAVRRVWAGLGFAAGLLVTGNLARIGLIAEMIHLYGLGTGYQVGHLVLGSLLSVVCIALSLLILALIVTGRRGQARGALPCAHRGSAA